MGSRLPFKMLRISRYPSIIETVEAMCVYLADMA